MRRRRARAAISRAFHLHVQFMYRTRVLDFHIDGASGWAGRGNWWWPIIRR